jgi:PelA/Pel-15E family pectate lyase
MTNYIRHVVFILVLFPFFAGQLCGADAETKLRADAQAAIRRAGEYYRTKVAVHGGYVYYYSPDLTQRLGEGVATPEQVWIQPPSTPTVGLAYLAAFESTGDKLFLEAAQAAGEAMLYGQLKSGGWRNNIDFDPRSKEAAQYRNGKGKGSNNSTLDDGSTQAAIRFMARLDQALGFKDQKVHEAVGVALDALLKAQYPCGAFPQTWTGPVPQTPVLKASYPDYDWRTEGKIKNYWDMYTLNDGLAGTVCQTLLDAHAIYKEPKYRAALEKLGLFLILAQMPDPQPAWSQQYGYEMHPIWARRFEPAAITGSESQDAMETLMRISELTGDKKFLQPIPRAIAYLRRSLLPDGRLARYYELKSNRPLYMTRRNDEYSLTYDDRDLPSHYGWKVASRLDAIEQEYQSLTGSGRTLKKEPTLDELRPQVQRIVSDLDDQGRWVSTFAGEPLTGQPKFKQGQQYISSAVFSRNLDLLSRFLAATK